MRTTIRPIPTSAASCRRRVFRTGCQTHCPAFCPGRPAIPRWQGFLCSASAASPLGTMRWISCCWDARPCRYALRSWNTATALSTICRRACCSICNKKDSLHWMELRGLALPKIVAPEKLDRTRRLRCEPDRNFCIGCGRCYLSCLDGGHQATQWEGRRPEVAAATCVGCGLCTLVCPTEACRLIAK